MSVILLALLILFEVILIFLAKRYFSVISIGRSGHGWVVSRDGTMLFSPEPGLTGTTVIESFRNDPSVLRVAADMLRGNRGETSYTLGPDTGGKTAAGRHFAVYMPIRFGTTFWSIVVASSEEEVLSSLVSFRNRLVLIMSLLLLGGVGFAFFGVKAWLIVREQENRRRVEEALRESEERFRELADSLPQTVFETDMAGLVRPNHCDFIPNFHSIRIV